MKKKKVLKVTLSVILLLGALFFIYSYYNSHKNNEVEESKYPHYIGYINQETAFLNSKYSLCNKDTIYTTYSGAGSFAYKGSKKQFRDNLKATFKTNNYTESGYLNFRFLVNCNGDAGWFEIIEMDLNLEEIDLEDKMVEELLELTSKSGNWSKLGFEKGNTVDYYMYISYRIENGQIIEILP